MGITENFLKGALDSIKRGGFRPPAAWEQAMEEAAAQAAKSMRDHIDAEILKKIKGDAMIEQIEDCCRSIHKDVMRIYEIWGELLALKIDAEIMSGYREADMCDKDKRRKETTKHEVQPAIDQQHITIDRRMKQQAQRMADHSLVDANDKMRSLFFWEELDRVLDECRRVEKHQVPAMWRYLAKRVENAIKRGRERRV